MCTRRGGKHILGIINEITFSIKFIPCWFSIGEKTCKNYDWSFIKILLSLILVLHPIFWKSYFLLINKIINRFGLVQIIPLFQTNNSHWKKINPNWNLFANPTGPLKTFLANLSAEFKDIDWDFNSASVVTPCHRHHSMDI